jgi:hypothetical protein
MGAVDTRGVEPSRRVLGQLPRLSSHQGGSVSGFRVFPRLAAVGLTRQNQPDRLAAHGVGNRQNPAHDPAEREPPFLGVSAARILGVEPERIKRGARGVLDRQAVLGDVARGLGLVPLES